MEAAPPVVWATFVAVGSVVLMVAAAEEIFRRAVLTYVLAGVFVFAVAIAIRL